MHCGSLGVSLLGVISSQDAAFSLCIVAVSAYRCLVSWSGFIN